MARIPRILITGDPTVYHVISRTALEGRNGDRQIMRQVLLPAVVLRKIIL